MPFPLKYSSLSSASRTYTYALHVTDGERSDNWGFGGSGPMSYDQQLLSYLPTAAPSRPRASVVGYRSGA